MAGEYPLNYEMEKAPATIAGVSLYPQPSCSLRQEIIEAGSTGPAASAVGVSQPLQVRIVQQYTM